MWKFALAFTPAGGWLLAQAGGASSDGLSVVSLIAQVGISGVFIWLYQQERKERIRQQDAATDLARTAYPLLTTVAESLKNVNASLVNTTRIATQAPTETVAGLDHAMAAIAVELKALREERQRE